MKGKNNPMFGKKCSEEVIKKISETRKKNYKYKTILIYNKDDEIIYKIINTTLQDFCKQHSLPYTYFYRTLKGGIIDYDNSGGANISKAKKKGYYIYNKWYARYDEL